MEIAHDVAAQNVLFPGVFAPEQNDFGNGDKRNYKCYYQPLPLPLAYQARAMCAGRG